MKFSRRGKQVDRKPRSTFGENVKTILIAVLIAIFIRTFFVQAFRIPSGSMEDTLLVGDFLLVDKITYGAKFPGTSWRLPGLRKPRRGDILVFKDPRTNRDFIKRCIAVGGETIEVRSNEVFIDGMPLHEPYKVLKWVPGIVRENYGPRRIPAGTLFMMGDNRNNSQDSRYWNELALERVVGRAFVLYWSSNTEKAPGWLERVPDSPIPLRGILSLFLGRPRLTRIGTWLAKDYSGVYREGLSTETP